MGSTVQNYTQHDSILAVEDRMQSTECGVHQELWTVQIPVPPTRRQWEETYPCTLLGFRTFTGAWSRWVSQQHSRSSCTYKTKDIYCPWENTHGWEVCLLWLDPFLPTMLCHQPGVLSLLLKNIERLQNHGWQISLPAGDSSVCCIEAAGSLGKMQWVVSVDTVCHGLGGTYSILDCSVAIPVPRVVPSGRAALVPHGVVGWPLSPPGSSLDAPCCCAEGVPVVTPCISLSCL